MLEPTVWECQAFVIETALAIKKLARFGMFVPHDYSHVFLKILFTCCCVITLRTGNSFSSDVKGLGEEKSSMISILIHLLNSLCECKLFIYNITLDE